MNNIIIAKQLIKFAKLLIAENDDESYFDNTIANADFDGFTKNNEDGVITFVYDKDETGGSYIVFEKDNCGYTVFIDSESTKDVSKNTCEEAFEYLKNHIDTYVRSFDAFLKKQEELNQEQTYENLGSYKLGKSTSRENAFRITFIPSVDDKKMIDKSIQEIKQNFQNQLFDVKTNISNQMFVITMNPTDINYIRETLKDYGWSK